MRKFLKKSDFAKKFEHFSRQTSYHQSFINSVQAYVNGYDSIQLSFQTPFEFNSDKSRCGGIGTSHALVCLDWMCVRFGLTKSSNLFIHSQKSNENQMNVRNSCEYDCVHIHTSWTICVHDSVSCLMYVMKESSGILFQIFIQKQMQGIEKFTFLKVYADSISELAKWDEDLAKELCRKIVQYWIYWIDEKSENVILEAMFISFRNMIDRWKEISIANTENWKKWWRPKKPKKTETKANENRTESETKANESKIENRNNKIENRNNEIRKDIEEKKINKKKKFLDFVELSEEEHEKLVQKFGERHTNELIEKLNNYIWSTWKKYKSHYYTILNRSKNETTNTNEYLKEQAIQRHREKIKEQIQSFNSSEKQNGETWNESWWYNRRQNIWFS